MNKDVEYWDGLKAQFENDLEQGVPIDYFNPELESTLEELIKEAGIDAPAALLEQVAYDVYIGSQGNIDFNKMVEPEELASIMDKVESEAYSHVGLSDAANYFLGSGDKAKSNVVDKLIQSDFQPVINYFYNVHSTMQGKIQEIIQKNPDQGQGNVFNYTKKVANFLYDKFTTGQSEDAGPYDKLLTGFYKKYGSLILDREELHKILLYGIPYVYSTEGKTNIMNLVNEYKKGIGAVDDYYEQDNIFQSLREEG